jgi:hypothetical protein
VASLIALDVSWGAASRPLDAERGMGDGGLVLNLPQGTLLAVVDGVGHGAAAAFAAQSAISRLESAAGPDLRATVSACHDGLKPTRGAAMGLAWLDRSASTLTWLGVGSIAGVLHRRLCARTAAAPLMPQGGGVVGRRLPTLRPVAMTVQAGDTIVLGTDGLDPGFIRDLPTDLWSEQRVAEQLIRTHATGQDDAFVLVARCAERAS